MTNNGNGRNGRRMPNTDQSRAVGKALENVVLALDTVKDCQCCGSEIINSWLDPVVVRLIYAKNYLSDALREGGTL